MGFEGAVGILPDAVEAGYSHLACLFGKAGERVEQGAMSVGVDQRAIVVLAVDLDQELACLTHHLHAETGWSLT